MLGATWVFLAQDALSRHLAESYNVWVVVTLRYWFFALAATAGSCGSRRDPHRNRN